MSRMNAPDELIEIEEQPASFYTFIKSTQALERFDADRSNEEQNEEQTIELHMGDNEAFGLLFGKTVREVFLANTPNNRKSHEESDDYRVKPSLQPSSKPTFLDTPYAYDNPRDGKGSRWKGWQDDKLEFNKLFEKEFKWDGQATTYRQFMLRFEDTQKVGVYTLSMELPADEQACLDNGAGGHIFKDDRFVEEWITDAPIRRVGGFTESRGLCQP